MMKKIAALLLIFIYVISCLVYTQAEGNVTDAIEYQVYDTYQEGGDIFGYFSFTYHDCVFEFCVSKLGDGRKLVELSNFRTQDNRTGSIGLDWEIYHLGKETNPENIDWYLFCRQPEESKYIVNGKEYYYYWGVYKDPDYYDDTPAFSPSILQVYVDIDGKGRNVAVLTYNGETNELVGHMTYSDWHTPDETEKHLAYIDWNRAPQMTPLTLTPDPGVSADIPQVTKHPQYGDLKYVSSISYKDYRFDFYEGKYRIVILTGPGLDHYVLDDDSGWAGPDLNAWYYDQSGNIAWDDPEWVINSCLGIDD